MFEMNTRLSAGTSGETMSGRGGTEMVAVQGVAAPAEAGATGTGGAGHAIRDNPPGPEVPAPVPDGSSLRNMRLELNVEESATMKPEEVKLL